MAGRDFYGPDGVYPFAGRECARAFALLSTDVADCNDNLDALTRMDIDNLHQWEAKFHSKYRVIGKLVASHEDDAARPNEHKHISS